MDHLYPDAEEKSPSPALIDLSDSSGLNSLPSANKLAEISIGTDVSDSEMDASARSVLHSVPFQEQFGRTEDQQYPNYLVDIKSQDNHIPLIPELDIDMKKGMSQPADPFGRLNMPPVQVSNPPLGLAVTTNASLGDVRSALRENGNLLTDRGFLEELLHSIDEKLPKEKTNEFALLSQSSLPTRDLGQDDFSAAIPNFTEQNFFSSSTNPTKYARTEGLFPTSETLKRINMNDVNSMNNQKIAPISVVDEHLQYPQLSPVLVSPGIPGINRNAKNKSLGKHVKFDEVPVIESPRSNVEELTVQEASQDYLKMGNCSEILKQMATLRWKLAGWESVGAAAPTDNKSALHFIHQLLNLLQKNQLQKQLLEEEFQKLQFELKKSNQELYVLKGTETRRDARLQKADKQLAVIQKEWLMANQKLQSQLVKMDREAQQLRQERDTMREESAKMKPTMENLMLTVKDTESQLYACRVNFTEALEENKRLSQQIQEKEKCLNEIETVRLPQTLSNLESARNGKEEAEAREEVLMRRKAYVEDDLRLLQQQHETLLKKVVEEQETKEEIIREKCQLEKQVQDLTKKVVCTKQELHTHYQAQVEDLVIRKSQSLQDELNKLEGDLKGSLEDQLHVQRRTHMHAVAVVKSRHEEQLKSLQASHTAQLAQVQLSLKAVEAENEAMKSQHQGVLTAVSSILGHKQARASKSQNYNSPDVLWEKSEMSTSTPISTADPTSPLIQHPQFSRNPSITSTLSKQHTLGGSHGIQFSSVSAFSAPGVGQGDSPSQGSQKTQVPSLPSTSSARPNSGSSSRPKSSRGEARPNSGKSLRGNVGTLDLPSSSSDSEGSIFQDGRQTVRQAMGGSLCTIPQDNLDKGGLRPWNAGGDRDFVPISESKGEKEYRSLPDLQIQNVLKSSGSDPDAAPIYEAEKPWEQHHQNKPLRCDDGRRHHYRDQWNRRDGEMRPSNRSSSRSTKSSSTKTPNLGVPPKVFKASEILQSSDLTDFTDHEEENPKPTSIVQVDREMVRLLHQLPSFQNGFKTSSDEEPTHDTSIDQDPASITLHKLSQVSTILSQYVAQSPA